MNHKMLRPFIIKVSVLCYFPLLDERNIETLVLYLKLSIVFFYHIYVNRKTYY